MEAGGPHRLVVLSLAIVATNSMVATVRDHKNGIRVVVIDGSANRGILGEPLDVLESFLLRSSPLEFNTLLGEVGED